MGKCKVTFLPEQSFFAHTILTEIRNTRLDNVRNFARLVVFLFIL